METTTETDLQEQPHHEPDMVLSQEAQYYLQQAGKWASFLAIMGFIGCGLIVIVALFFIFAMSSRSGYSVVQVMSIFAGIIYLGIAFLVFYINYKLYLFANNIQKGIAFVNNDMVTNATNKLHSFFKIKSIIVIVVITFYVLVIIIMLTTRSNFIRMPHYPGTGLS